MTYLVAYCQISLLKLIQYRTNFFLASIANLVHYGTSLSLISILMSRFETINGWSRDDVMFLYAFALLSFSIFGMIFQQLAGFSNLILQGRLDRMILRPRPIFLQVILEGINPVYVSHFIFSVTVMCYVVPLGGYEFTWMDIGFLTIAAICGVVIQLSVALVVSALSFFTMESASLFNLLIYGPRELIWYPVTIYPKFIQGFLIFIVPFAFINFFPLSTVLSLSAGSYPTWMGWMCVVAAFVMAALAASLWRYGLSKYSSTGS